MTIEFKDRRYFAAMYFVGNEKADWLAAIWRDGPWNIQYRFRYHVDDKVFDSDDVKNWYHWTALEADEDKVVAKFDEMAKFIANNPQSPTFGSDLRKVLIQSSDTDVILAALEKENFTHFKWMSPEEAREMEREATYEVN